MQPAVRRKSANHRVPIELYRDGADQEVEATTELLDGRRVSARGNLVRSEALCLIELALARRECCHVEAVRGGELHGHVTQPADADDAYPLGRLGVHDQWREDGHAPAQERSEVNGFEDHRLLRRLRNPGLILRLVSYSETSAGLDGGGRHRLFLLQSAS